MNLFQFEEARQKANQNGAWRKVEELHGRIWSGPGDPSELVPVYDPTYSYETWQEELNRLLEQYKPMKDPTSTVASSEAKLLGLDREPALTDVSTFDDNLDEDRSDQDDMSGSLSRGQQQVAKRLMQEEAIRSKAVQELMTPDEREAYLQRIASQRSREESEALLLQEKRMGRLKSSFKNDETGHLDEHEKKIIEVLKKGAALTAEAMAGEQDEHPEAVIPVDTSKIVPQGGLWSSESALSEVEKKAAAVPWKGLLGEDFSQVKAEQVGEESLPNYLRKRSEEDHRSYWDERSRKWKAAKNVEKRAQLNNIQRIRNEVMEAKLTMRAEKENVREPPMNPEWMSKRYIINTVEQKRWGNKRDDDAPREPTLDVMAAADEKHAPHFEGYDRSDLDFDHQPENQKYVNDSYKNNSLAEHAFRDVMDPKDKSGARPLKIFNPTPFLHQDVKDAMYRLHQSDPVKYHSQKLAAMFGITKERSLAILRLLAKEREVLGEDLLPFVDDFIHGTEHSMTREFSSPLRQIGATWDPVYYPVVLKSAKIDFVDEGDALLIRAIEESRLRRFYDKNVSSLFPYVQLV